MRVCCLAHACNCQKKIHVLSAVQFPTFFLLLFSTKKKKRGGGGGGVIGTESADGSCCVYVVQLHGGDQSGGLVYVVIDRAFHPNENMHVSRLVCGVLMIECSGGGYMEGGGGVQLHYRFTA